MIITVSDANILIDLAELDLLEHFTQLHFEFHTNDFIINEIKDPKQKHKVNLLIKKGNLIVAQTKATEYTEISNLQANNLSFADCAILYYTQKTGGILLSGDGNLRKTARKLNIDVRGIFYILDEMLAQMILTNELALQKLILLSKINSRLPQDEIIKRMEQWRTK